MRYKCENHMTGRLCIFSLKILIFRKFHADLLDIHGKYQNARKKCTCFFEASKLMSLIFLVNRQKDYWSNMISRYNNLYFDYFGYLLFYSKVQRLKAVSPKMIKLINLVFTASGIKELTCPVKVI